MVLRASGGPSILKELSNEEIAMDMEDAVRLNAAGVGIQVFIGGEFETRSIHNMTRLVDAGLRCGMPVMGVTAVGKDMVRDAKYFRLACRIIAELGAQYVKTYYVAEGFETVTASCPVPIVMAGGKKLPELEALTMAYNAVQQGAAGVDMGRNIFQSDAPKAMIAGRARGRAPEHEAGAGAGSVQIPRVGRLNVIDPLPATAPEPAGRPKESFPQRGGSVAKPASGPPACLPGACGVLRTNTEVLKTTPACCSGCPACRSCNGSPTAPEKRRIIGP